MKKETETQELKDVGFSMRIEPGLLSQVKDAAWRARVSVAQYVRGAMRRELKRKVKEKKAA